MTNLNDAMFKELDANAAEIKAWWEALTYIADANSPAVTAIRVHINTLTNKHARILGLSEDEIAKIDAEAEAAVNRTIAQEVEQIWQTLEAELPRQEFLEIKNFIDGLRR